MDYGPESSIIVISTSHTHPFSHHITHYARFPTAKTKIIGSENMKGVPTVFTLSPPNKHGKLHAETISAIEIDSFIATLAKFFVLQLLHKAADIAVARSSRCVTQLNIYMS